jgi:hypothetical protein
MGDMGEDYRLLREQRKQKKRNNIELSTQALIDRNIPFESKKDGAHLIVDGKVDFWPSTGLFIARYPGTHRDRGVFKLIAWLAKQ